MKRLVVGVVWAGAELVVAGFDWLTMRDTEREYRRFLAEHPDVTVHRVEAARRDDTHLRNPAPFS